MRTSRLDTLDLPGMVLAVLGATLVALSLFMLVAPGVFLEEVAPFGARSDHYIRDGATFQLALGVLALIAVAKPGLRLAAIGVMSLQFFLHAANHLADIGDASPRWLSVANFVALGAGLALLVCAYVLARRSRS